MAVSPVAMVALAWAAATLLRRLELPERAVRYELRVGQAASVAMSAFFVGACLWLFDGEAHVRPGKTHLFHAGAIDVVGAVVMALAILCAHQAVFRGLSVARRAPAR
jgi:hypothetical protein